MPRLSAQTTGILLLLMAIVSWGVVLAEAAIVHTVSLLSVGSAVLVTGLVFAWPFLNGARVAGSRVIQLDACRFCGTIPVPALKFCIRCGAYPKASQMRLA
ncbi:MAG: hypothetical protein QOG31_1840 [Thermoplasmata archaeon]|jgi:hypothetical protein|nr:hypothetical protein [Thermoplasmata archaeon]